MRGAVDIRNMVVVVKRTRRCDEMAMAMAMAMGNGGCDGGWEWEYGKREETLVSRGLIVVL